MLEITVGATNVYDEETQTFRDHGGDKLQLEHSLVSLSKWEAKHEKPFLDGKPKTGEELLSYVDCMLLTTNPPGDYQQKLSEENFEQINTYINRKMTATWFSEIDSGRSRNTETPTAELIYYWMSVFQIDLEAQHWHLNRLFTLIRIANLKQEKPKKMSPGEIARRNRELNEKRKREMNTTG